VVPQIVRSNQRETALVVNERNRLFTTTIRYNAIRPSGLESMYSLELGDEVSNVNCTCCGEQFKSVCGFIKKDNDAYSVYFATLHTGHAEILASLTISIGKWWDDTALNERHWIELTVKPSESKRPIRTVLTS
jgi:hypothetical protein